MFQSLLTASCHFLSLPPPSSIFATVPAFSRPLPSPFSLLPTTIYSTLLLKELQLSFNSRNEQYNSIVTIHSVTNEQHFKLTIHSTPRIVNNQHIHPQTTD
ncbi:hypothetical protein HYFRA_00008196 [Hymenoscyphus fraxineus]|uniref:Uncharacterized protein n=1 Tax=Hymenoscyphus fraxineus TaxID=746836 RepID=A0A9N9LBL2_9HELO|nr:hypothetical protein HYFRA_00008196 [Hymenoscyphus fraxineus]